LGVEELSALRTAEPDSPISVFDLRKPMIASDGFFAHKTLIIRRVEAVRIAVAHLIRCARGDHFQPNNRSPLVPRCRRALPTFGFGERGWSIRFLEAA